MKLKKLLPFLIAFFVFAIASLLYFHPVLKGKQIKQSDITQFKGMVKEINDFRADKNEEPYWTGASFSGMPAYQISTYYPNDFVRKVDQAIRFLPRPADYTFLYFLSFFVLMLALKVDWRLAVFGSLAFGFSTYLIIIFGAGHNAKAHAIGYMPLVIAGVLWIFDRKFVLGFLVTSLSMALEVYSNHIQMTYYLGFCLFILGIVEFINALKEKRLASFVNRAAVVMASIILGVAMNAPRLLAMKEYADFSTRGKSELTVNPDGTTKLASEGLDESYITEYSYAKLETFNLFIPRFMGGGTVEALDDDSNFYKTIAEKAGKATAKNYSEQVLTYWGDQPIIEAPAYIGAVIFFLFFLGIFIVKGKLKQWLVATTIFAILLSWGRNFEILTGLFIEYVPLYNKFRAVSSIQVIAELCVPVLAVLALKYFFSKSISNDEKIDALKKASISFGGLIIIGFVLAHFSSSFVGLRDSNYDQLPGLVDALISDRKAMLFVDTLRSLLFVILSAGLLWFFVKEKIKSPALILGLAVLMLFDLISVNLNYVNTDDFETPRKIAQNFKPNNADKLILKDKGHYRVANFANGLMQDGVTSYFHQSIGGYHAAKLGRYQELFDYQISKNNMQVLNMLNTKYFIFQDDKGEYQVQQNQEANGNAWFVEQLIAVNSANEEILALDSLQTKKGAVVDISQMTLEKDFSLFKNDSTATITLNNYEVNTLTYQSKTNSEQFAVFSEIFYEDGWNAYVDGELTPHFRVDYVLRGMFIPKGKHEIVFRFEPEVIQKGSFISLSAYSVFVLVFIGWFFYDKKKKRKARKLL
ncbi:YfhO family protein [Polaribacter sp.]|nr:YfhO family protein [Polaribacter sp.]